MTSRKTGIYFLLLFFFGSVSAQDIVSQNNPDRIYATGLELMQHSEFGAAREAFHQYLSLPGISELRKAEASYYEAFCALNLYHSDGEKKIERFIDNYPDHPKAALAFYELGNFYYAEKNYSKAANAFGKVDFPILSNEQHAIGRFHWGYSLFNLRKLNDALDQFNFIKALGGQFGPASSYYAGFIEMQNGDYENALIDLKRAEQNDSYSKVVPYLVANAYYKQHSYDALIGYVSSLEGRDGISNREEISLLVAEAYFEKRDYQKALLGYRDYFAVIQSGVSRSVLFKAGYAAYIVNDSDAALQYLKGAASDKDSTGFYSSYYLGSLYLKQGEKQLALTAFENARKLKSDKKLVEESSLQYAKISYDLGRPDQAIEALELFLTQFPQSTHTTEVKEVLSQAYVNANNYNKAIEYIESLPSRAPAVDRAYQKATLLKGIELFNMEQYADAVALFDKSLQYPQDTDYVAEAAFWRGEAYSIGRKYEEAAESYLKVIGISGLNNQDLLTKTRYGLGYAYFNLQQYDRALFNFREFVKSGPNSSNYPDGVLRLADCYYVTKAYPDALSSYRRTLQLNSTDKDYAHLQAGVILGIQRKYVDAARELDQVINNYPQSRFMDEALFQRAQFEFEQGNYSAAIAGFTKLINTNKGSKFVPYAYLRRAASYYNLKDYNRTAEDYITVVDEYTSHPVANDALLPLQEALTLAGRPGEFDSHLSAFKSSNPDSKGIEIVEFETAKNLYFSQDYNRAIQNLGNYLNNYQDSPRVTEAKFYQAESYYRISEFQQSLTVHKEIKDDLSFTLNGRVIARIAELEFKLGNYDKAIPVFQQLSRMATTKKDQFNAWSGLMESHYLLAQYDSVNAYAKLILEQGNVNAGAHNKASLYLGKAAMARGNYELAKDEFLTTLNSARDEYGAEAKYLLGEIFYLSKEHKQCYETLVSLNTDFASYTEWVGKSYLLLSDNFVATGDLFQAKGTLNSLIDHFPLENIKSLAKEKLKRIEQLEVKEEQKNMEQDTINRTNN